MKIVTADITGSLIVNGVDVTNNVVSSSVFSGSIAGRVTNLEQFSSSLDATFATDASVTASILILSQSVQASEAALSSSYALTSGSYVITSGSYAAASASLSTRVTNTEATASTNTQASASFAAYSGSMSTRLTTDETNITTLTNASASFAVQSASLSIRVTNLESTSSTVSSSFASTSGSLSTRVTNLESTSSTVSSSFATTSGSIAGRVTIIEGQDATTGSNIFTGPQFINQASNAISFTSTASLYTDGGLRVSKDSYVSGTAYFNNVVVYGTSSIQYITSSQVNFGTNIITVNTDTPAVRFGGLAVFDSGSTQLTGSMLWDSEKNHWIYSNPSGSSYNSAMLMNGPRNTGSLGNEQGTTSCALMMGQGGDHITSSMIYSYGNATCFYGQSFISSSGTICTTGIIVSSVSSTATACSTLNLISGCVGIGGTLNPSNPLHIYTNTDSNSSAIKLQNASACCLASVGIEFQLLTDFCDYKKAEIRAVASEQYANSIDLAFWSGGSTAAKHTERLRITSEGISCFACQVCAPAFIGGTVCGTNATFIGQVLVNTDTSTNGQLVVSSVGFDDTILRVEQRRSGYASALNLIGVNDAGAAYNYIASGTNSGVIHWRVGGNGTACTLVLSTAGSERLTISCTGAATFSCKVFLNTTTAYTSELNVQAIAANRPAIKAGYGGVSGNGYWILGDNYTTDESLMSIGIDYSSGGLVLGSALAPSTTNQGCFISTQAQFGGYGSAIRLSTSGEILFYNGTQNSVISTGCAKSASIALTIAQTGAATFSNSVAAGGSVDITGGSLASSNGLHLWFNTSTSTAHISAFNTGVDWRSMNFNALDYVFRTYDGARLTITSAGAAAFTNTVTAAGIITGTTGVNVGANALGADRMFQISGTSFTTSTTQFAAVINPSFCGTITNVFGVYAGNNFSAGTITNSYNLYIEGTSAGSATISNRYGLYQAGGSDKNYFAGDVGIGIASPSARLQTVSSGLGDSGGIRITNTGSGGDDYRIWPTATVNGEGAGKLIFTNNAGNVLTLTSCRNVGIGTTAPAYKLDVSGATRVGSLLVSNSTTTTWCVGRIDDARANTWYTIYTWPGIYDGAFTLAQLGYEDNNGDGANTHAFWMTVGPAYATGFSTYQIGGATNLCLQRSGQSLQALITGVTDRTSGAYLGYTLQTMIVAS